jgi:hypothetical protein
MIEWYQEKRLKCTISNPIFSHQLNRVVEHIKTNRSSQRSVDLVLLDVERVFDSVWLEGLQQKLVISNCYLYLTEIISSFLNGPSFHVCVIKTNSAILILFLMSSLKEPFLSPSLHNFFIVNSHQSNECETATFVDDTVIFVSNDWILNEPTRISSNILVREFKVKKNNFFLKIDI